MAINLNKGGDEKKKFNLVKSDAPPTVNKPETTDKSESTGKSKLLWLLLIPAIGIGVWLAKPKKTNSDDEIETTKMLTSNIASESNGNPSNGVLADENSMEGTNKANADEPIANKESVEATPGSTSAKEEAKSAGKNLYVQFLAGSAALKGVGNEIMANVVSKLKANSKLRVKVAGYASSEGDLASNNTLAERRANTFKHFLLGHGVLASQIEVESKGIDNPIASNDTEKGRSQNRRVEITVIE